MSHFRTFTIVVEIADDSDLAYPGAASHLVRKQLERLDFLSLSIRNSPNPTGEMPPAPNREVTR